MLKLTSFSPNLNTPRLSSAASKSVLRPDHTAIANLNKSASTAPTETVSLSSTGSFGPLNANSGQAKIVTSHAVEPNELPRGYDSGPILLEAFAPQTQHNSNIDGFLTRLTAQAVKDNGTFSTTGMNFSESAKVVSSAQKFIIPVPTFAATGGGEGLVYPSGATNKEGQSIAGQPIADWEGKPIGGPGEKGVVFFNEKDQSYQAVKADGNGVIIMNQVTDDQGKKLQSRIGNDPSKLSLKEFKDALEYAHSELGIGDKYNSDRDFITSKMNAMETSDTGVAHYGLYRRDDRDVCEVLVVDGKGAFQGPAATPQKFEDGAVILRQPDSKAEDGFSYRLIQPDAFKETYTNIDGSPVDIASLPRHEG